MDYKLVSLTVLSAAAAARAQGRETASDGRGDAAGSVHEDVALARLSGLCPRVCLLWGDVGGVVGGGDECIWGRGCWGFRGWCAEAPNGRRRALWSRVVYGELVMVFDVHDERHW